MSVLEKALLEVSQKICDNAGVRPTQAFITRAQYDRYCKLLGKEHVDLKIKQYNMVVIE